MAATLQEFDSALQMSNYLLNQVTRKYLEEKGLSLPRYWVLLNTDKYFGLTMGELQNKMYLAPSSITALVDSLVTNGLLERGTHPEDRRVIKLYLTEEGKKVLEDVLNFRHERLKEALAGMEPTVYPLLKEALDGLTHYFKKQLCNSCTSGNSDNSAGK